MDKKVKEIYYLQNVAAIDVAGNLASEMDKEIWQYGVMTPTYGWTIEDPKPMWWCDFVKNRWHEALYRNIIDCLEQINPVTKNYIFKMINAQAGGRTYGIDGSIHIDHDFEFNQDGDGFMTFLYFAHTEWEAEWGGEVQFFGDNGEIIASYTPMPNTCIVFDSNIPHRGLAPVRDCTKLRKHVSIKVQAHKMWSVTDSLEFTDLKPVGNIGHDQQTDAGN
jgi:hypothetical protein